MRRGTVAVDFDGVLHSYTSPWNGHDVIPDPPIPGAIEWLHQILGVYDVVIFTTRGASITGAAAVQSWLIDHGYRGPPLHVTNEKPPALVYIDDRGWRFEGEFPSVEEIAAAHPWKIIP